MASKPGASPNIKLTAEPVLRLREAIHEFVEKEGIPGVMPTVNQLRDIPDAPQAIARCGGVLRAAKALNLLLTCPKPRNGAMTIETPGTGYGDKKNIFKVTLDDEMQGRMDLLRGDAEYKKRLACKTLDKDLFIQEAMNAVRAMVAKDPSVGAAASATPASGDGAAAAAKKADSPPEAPLAFRRKVRQLKSPRVLIAGGVGDVMTYQMQGRRVPECVNLPSPHVMTALSKIHVEFVAASPSSAHIICIAKGEGYAWGTNGSGQLGLGDNEARDGPARVQGLEGKLVHAATGGKHSLFVMDSGRVMAAGAGEKGATSHTADLNSPKLVGMLEGVVEASCGKDFSLALTRDGDVYSWGWSEHGCLGHGTNGEFNTSAASVKLTYTPVYKPDKIAALSDPKVVQISSGADFSAALSSDGICYTWGCGDYGRLGTRKQESLWIPTAIQETVFRTINCGTNFVAAMGWTRKERAVQDKMGVLYLWGKVPKGAASDAWMYPRVENELAGWAVESVGCGGGTVVVAADRTCIAWGGAVMHRELGLGPDGPKTACRPTQVDALAGLDIVQTTGGLGHVVWLAEGDPAILAKEPEASRALGQLDHLGPADVVDGGAPPAAAAAGAAVAGVEAGGAAGDAAIVVGQRVQVKFTEGVFKGTVVQLFPGGKIRVKYDDGEEEEMKYPDDDVELLEEEQAAKRQKME